ncbi:MAG: flagellin FliC, partial [Magnetococcales bacterium]|nr:flagellin FliC [Magnetococcales bacterium]
NTSAARSRIMDADIAAETSQLTKNSILQQAATAILAQANQQPQMALQLLG